MLSFLCLFLTLGLAFDFDGYSCDGGGDSAKNFQWMNTYALFQAFVPPEKSLKEGMEQLFKDVAIGSNSGGSWFATALLHDPKFQAMFKMKEDELKDYIAAYWTGIDREKERLLDPKTKDGPCSGVGTDNALSRSVFNSLLKALIKKTGEDDLITGEDAICFDKETGVNKFWTLFRQADDMHCGPEPTFDAGNTVWNILSGMFQDGMYKVEHWNMMKTIGKPIKFDSRMWEFPQWRDDPAMDGPVIPFFLEVDYGGEKVVDKKIDVPYWKEMHPDEKVKVTNYDWNCLGPKRGATSSTCEKSNEDTVSVTYDEFVQPMMDQFMNTDFPKQVNYPSSEALVYTGSHWPMAFLDQLFPLIDDGSLTGDAEEEAVGVVDPAALLKEEEEQAQTTGITDGEWIIDYMTKQAEKILRKVTSPDGPLTLSKWIEAFTVAHLRLVQPQTVGEVAGRKVAYSHVDGGVFDNGGYSGTIKGLQKLFPDAKSGKRILAFDGSPSDIPRAMGIVKNFSPMPPPWPVVNMGPAEQILEDNYENPEFVWQEGLSTLSMWKVTTVENPSHGIKGGYEYDFYYLQGNYTQPPFVCMVAEEACTPYYSATVDNVKDVIKLLQKLDALEPSSTAPQSTSPQSASPHSSRSTGGEKPALHTLDQEYHLKEENTDAVFDKEESWTRNERREKNQQAVVVEQSDTQSLAVNFFAVVGFGVLAYGALKHYSSGPMTKEHTPLV